MMKTLKRIRVLLATIFLIGITGLFLDFTGVLHGYLGWMAKVQFVPALLAHNLVIIGGLILLTLLLGRVYCSVICPLGSLQDLVAQSKTKKNRYRFSPAMNWLRYGVLALFVVMLLMGVGSVVSLLEPYSAFGRIAANLFAPIYQWGNNLLAYFAERVDSYAFYRVDIWIKGMGILAISVATLIVIALLAWRGGRTYCNTICPVGTALGFLSKFAIYKHRIVQSKCNGCGLCARNCKASCIDSKNHTIDYSRCVACFNCIEKCSTEAIVYAPCTKRSEKAAVAEKEIDASRRNMLTIAGAMAVTSVVKAQEKEFDGGLAYIEDKRIPERQTRIVPPGAHSIRNFAQHCTGCQLCVSACPNQLLRPSTGLTTFMQPEMSYERGYCRPECVKCSQVCPAGAIKPITTADKSSTQIGHAVWIEQNCVVLTDNVNCGNCARHCPVGAILMVKKDPDSPESREIPIVDVERCIGCGACEFVCPSRPFSAIYVEGHTMHRTV